MVNLKQFELVPTVTSLAEDHGEFIFIGIFFKFFLQFVDFGHTGLHLPGHHRSKLSSPRPV